MNSTKIEADWHHVAVSVTDMDDSIRFFCDNLGFEVEWDQDHKSGQTISTVVGLEQVEARFVMLEGCRTRLELIQYYQPVGRNNNSRKQCDFGISHFCFTVKNINKIYKELVSKGVQFNSTPQNLRPGVWAVYMQGPENIIIELLEYE